MAEGPGDGRPPVAAGPDAIRHEMARTREALAHGLDALKRRLFNSNPPPNTGARTIMVAKKKPSAGSSAKITKSEAAAKLGSGPKKTAAKKPAAASKGGTATASKAKAGAAPKAKAGAASKGGSGAKGSRSTAARKTAGVTTKAKEVLGEVLAGAAAGMVAGAAQAAVESLGQDGKPVGAEAEVRVGASADMKKSQGGKARKK